MIKINGEEVEWDRAPNFVNNVRRKVLWKDEKTGATFAILNMPKGVYTAQTPHSHPKASQFTFILSGEIRLPNGIRISHKKDDYGFRYSPIKEEHGKSPEGMKVNEDFIYLHYWDGPDDWGDKEAER